MKRIAILSASTAEVAALRRVIRSLGQYEVTWVAQDTREAESNCVAQPPDVLLLSIDSLQADAVDAVRRILQKSALPILLLASSISGQAATIFEALGAGAVDVVNLTSTDGTEIAGAPEALAAKLSMFRKLKSGNREPRKTSASKNGSKPDRMLLLGASAGGPSALATVLSGLPENFAAPVVIVQHIDEQFVGGMTEWLAQHCSLPVRIAPDQEPMENGVVYVAGRSEHLVLRDRYTFQYEPEPRAHPYKPSIDVLFFSAAKFWKDDAVGVLLTGMGQDGAAGLRKLRDVGALTITQDKATSVVFGIPKAAAKLNAAVEILPLPQIAARIRTAIPTPA